MGKTSPDEGYVLSTRKWIGESYSTDRGKKALEKEEVSAG